MTGPFDAEVALRAWGTLDGRVRDLLAEENQPGRHRRVKAVSERAERAGWPPTRLTYVEERAAQQRVLKRMGLWRDWRDEPRVPLTDRLDDAEREWPATIFDE